MYKQTKELRLNPLPPKALISCNRCGSLEQKGYLGKIILDLNVFKNGFGNEAVDTLYVFCEDCGEVSIINRELCNCPYLIAWMNDMRMNNEERLTDDETD